MVVGSCTSGFGFGWVCPLVLWVCLCDGRLGVGFVVVAWLLRLCFMLSCLTSELGVTWSGLGWLSFACISVVGWVSGFGLLCFRFCLLGCGFRLVPGLIPWVGGIPFGLACVLFLGCDVCLVYYVWYGWFLLILVLILGGGWV